MGMIGWFQRLKKIVHLKHLASWLAPSRCNKYFSASFQLWPFCLSQRVITRIKWLKVPNLNFKENIKSYQTRTFVRQILNLPLQFLLPFYFQYSQTAVQKGVALRSLWKIQVPRVWKCHMAIGANLMKPSGYLCIPTHISLAYRGSLQWLAVLEVCMSGELLSSFS